MNVDNERLREIQQIKSAYVRELHNSDSISDCIHYQTKIDELEKEEIEILQRFKVEI